MAIYRKLRHSLIKDRNKVRNWKNKLNGVPCFILGNAPHLDDYPVYKLKDCFTIGINRAFFRLDPTILLWQDIELYYDCRKRLSKLDAILFSRDVSDPRKMAYHYKLLYGDYKLTGNPSVLAGRGSSGPLAYQLAHVLGCDPIILMGCTCSYRDGKTDFYGVNKDHKSHTLKACEKGLKWMKRADKNRILVSCSQSDVFRNTITLDDAFEMFNIKKFSKGREYYVKKLFQ